MKKKLRYFGWGNFALFWVFLYFWVTYPSNTTLFLMMIPVSISIILGLFLGQLVKEINYEWLRNLRKKKIKKLNKVTK